jgi:hypothetical protein
MRMPAGWNIRVTTFDSEGNPRIVRNFLAYESDKEGAIELVRKRVPVNEGEPVDRWRIDAKRVRLWASCVGRFKKTKRDCLSSLPDFDAGDHEDRAAPS